jgi:hypothetical protein
MNGDINDWAFDTLPSLHQRSLVTPVFLNHQTNDRRQNIEQVVDCPTVSHNLLSDDDSSFCSRDTESDDLTTDSSSADEVDVVPGETAAPNGQYYY